MDETIEFRIPEDNAKKYLDATDGICLGGSVRKVIVKVSDPLFERIGRIDCAFRLQGESFFTAWIPRRRYKIGELQTAKCLSLNVKRVLEVTGEQFGTLYDHSSRCKYCGVGGEQVSDLILASRWLPKNPKTTIAKTIGGEVVVSKTFVELFQAKGLSGADFKVVRQHKNPELTVPGWYQMLTRSSDLKIVAPTRAGVSPFDDGSEPLLNNSKILDQLEINGSWCDRQGVYRCPLGHTIGLSLLSELTIECFSENLDIALTKQRVGVMRGLLRPQPILVVSPRFRAIMVEERMEGMGFDIVHLLASR